MTLERMVKLSILQQLETNGAVRPKFADWLAERYDLIKINEDYFPLLEEFLTDYALNNTEKSD